MTVVEAMFPLLAWCGKQQSERWTRNDEHTHAGPREYERASRERRAWSQAVAGTRREAQLPHTPLARERDTIAI